MSVRLVGQDVAADIKISPKGAPILERVLLVDANPSTARLLSDLLRNISLCQVHLATTDARAMILARDLDPQIVFVEMAAAGIDGLDFTRRLRRSDFSSRDCPVIMITAEATAAGILGARDAGVHEFLRRPFTMGDLQKRIDAVTLRKRDWVEAVAYVGPDRRRFNSADYSGPRKRRTDQGTPETQRIGQALKIVRSAVGAIESDPKQVFRALKVQADTLAAISLRNPKLQALGAAANALQIYLEEALKAGRLSREQLERHAASLMIATPEEARPDASRDGAQAA